MKQFPLIVLGIVIGSLATWIALDNNAIVIQNKAAEIESPENEDMESEDIEIKIEQINQLAHISPLELEENIEELFGDCNPDSERDALQARLACNRRDVKAIRFWSKMGNAEYAVSRMIEEKDIDGLMAHTSCDAYDLTWYEMHCESDRTAIQSDHFENLFKYLEESGLEASGKNNWLRKGPDPRKFRNPRWIMRSRLMVRGLKLKDPWLHSPHPTEHETVIMLEQKLDGRIYIVGVPVTGVEVEEWMG